MDYDALVARLENLLEEAQQLAMSLIDLDPIPIIWEDMAQALGEMLAELREVKEDGMLSKGG
jgi:hypothetical protein